MSGKGIYYDNGKDVPVKAGDMTYCHDSEWHGIENVDELENLEFIAIIVSSANKKGTNVG